ERVVRRPVAGGLSGTAVDDEVLRAFGHVGVEVVLQHAQRGLLRPAPRAESGAPGGTHRFHETSYATNTWRRKADCSTASSMPCACVGCASHIACNSTVVSASGAACRSNTSREPTAAGSTTSATVAAGLTGESVTTTDVRPISRANASASRTSRG